MAMMLEGKHSLRFEEKAIQICFQQKNRYVFAPGQPILIKECILYPTKKRLHLKCACKISFGVCVFIVVLDSENLSGWLKTQVSLWQGMWTFYKKER